jgi:hypothetical protein
MFALVSDPARERAGQPRRNVERCSFRQVERFVAVLERIHLEIADEGGGYDVLALLPLGRPERAGLLRGFGIGICAPNGLRRYARTRRRAFTRRCSRSKQRGRRRLVVHSFSISLAPREGHEHATGILRPQSAPRARSRSGGSQGVVQLELGAGGVDLIVGAAPARPSAPSKARGAWGRADRVSPGATAPPPSRVAREDDDAREPPLP